MNLRIYLIRLFSVLLLILSVFWMFSCKAAPSHGEGGGEVLPSEDPLGDLSGYLDGEGFVAGMTQEAFIARIHGYTYEGKPLDEAVPAFPYEMQGSKGWMGSGHRIFYKNDTSILADQVTERYLNSVSFAVPIGGLSLPCGISYDDSLDAACEKLGLGTRLLDRFTADDGVPTDMTLLSENGAYLVFRDLSRAELSAQFANPYRLIYSETQKIVLSDGRTTEIVRQVELSFTDDAEKSFYGIRMDVTELSSKK